jgi:hypothetical protein
MITKAFAPMPVRNLEMFLCVCAQLQLGTANPQKPTDSRTARSESKRSAAEPHTLYIYTDIFKLEQSSRRHRCRRRRLSSSWRRRIRVQQSRSPIRRNLDVNRNPTESAGALMINAPLVFSSCNATTLSQFKSLVNPSFPQLLAIDNQPKEGEAHRRD